MPDFPPASLPAYSLGSSLLGLPLDRWYSQNCCPFLCISPESLALGLAQGRRLIGVYRVS